MPFPLCGEKKKLELPGYWEVSYKLKKTLRPLGALEQCTYSTQSLKLDYCTPFPVQMWIGMILMLCVWHRWTFSGWICGRSKERWGVHGGYDEKFGPVTHCGHDQQPSAQCINQAGRKRHANRQKGVHAPERRASIFKNKQNFHKHVYGSRNRKTLLYLCIWVHVPVQRLKLSHIHAGQVQKNWNWAAVFDLSS